MQTTTKMWILTGVLLLARTSFAQAERESPNGFYRLDFVTNELDDTKLVSNQNYSMTVGDKNQGQIEASSRVPVPADSNGNFTYVDLGMNIDCRDLHEISGQLSLGVSVDISS